MLLKRPVNSFVVVLGILFFITGSGLAAEKGEGMAIPSVWRDINNNSVDLSVLAKEKGGLSILVFRAMGCAACIEKDIGKTKELYPDIVAVVGYVSEDELEFFKNKTWGIMLLRDEKYSFIQRLRMRQLSFLLRVDKNLSIIGKSELPVENF